MHIHTRYSVKAMHTGHEGEGNDDFVKDRDTPADEACVAALRDNSKSGGGDEG